jgi:hypothetical protein
MKNINSVLAFGFFGLALFWTTGCGQQVCIAGFGAGCGTAGNTSSASGTASPSGGLQINVSGSWPRQDGHLVVSTNQNTSLLAIAITGGTPPYTNLGFYTAGGAGTLGSLSALTAGNTATYTAPYTSTPSLVISVMDSNNATAYMPLVIDAN